MRRVSRLNQTPREKPPKSMPITACESVNINLKGLFITEIAGVANIEGRGPSVKISAENDIAQYRFIAYDRGTVAKLTADMDDHDWQLQTRVLGDAIKQGVVDLLEVKPKHKEPQSLFLGGQKYFVGLDAAGMSGSDCGCCCADDNGDITVTVGPVDQHCGLDGHGDSYLNSGCDGGSCDG